MVKWDQSDSLLCFCSTLSLTGLPRQANGLASKIDNFSVHYIT